MLGIGRRRTPEGAPGVVGTARVAEPGHLPTGRFRPGDVAVLDLPHLDRATAERLLARRPAAVLLAGPATSPRYPHRGPGLLLAGGVVVVDDLGEHLRSAVRDGTTVRVDGGRVLVGAGRDRWVDTPEPLHGREQDLDSVAAAVERASRSMAAQLEAFAEATGAVLQVERDLLLEGAGVPEVPVRMAGRPVVVCVPGYGHEDDLRRLWSFVADRKPVLVGVEAGADALVRAGLRPDLVVTDEGSEGGPSAAVLTSGAHVVVHALPEQEARDGVPGDLDDPADDVDEGTDGLDGPADDTDALGLLGGRGVPRPRGLGTEGPRGGRDQPGTTRFVSHLTTEDTAILLAHSAGASCIVTVGSHATLEEFLDRGRAGAASTFLTRLRAGGTVVDAATVARLHQPRRSWALVLLLVLAALVTVVSAAAATPWGQAQLSLVQAEVTSWPLPTWLGG